jgi:hypothetical protein
MSTFALRALRSRQILLAIVAVGVLLRLVQYLANRSLWVDESWLALNLLSHSVVDLMKPLEFAQGAPPGFLLGEYGIAHTLGFSEYALRLLPLVFGAASVAGFAWLARRLLSAAVAPLAVLLFAVSDGLIYYSSEVKPYEIDVAVSVGLLLIAHQLAERSPRIVQSAGLALAGLVCIALSFPAVFLVAAIAVALAVDAWSRRSVSWLRARAWVVALWALGSLGVIAFGVSRALHVWSPSTGRFLGVSGTSSLATAADYFGTNLSAALGFLRDAPFNQLQKLALIAALVGVTSLLRRDRVLLSVLVIPFALTFVASAAHAYPLSERTELFLVPSIILLLAEGAGAIVRWVPRWKGTIAIALSAGVVGGPAFDAAKHVVHPRHREELRPVLAFVRDHWQPGDVLYLHNYAQYAFLYYDRCGCLSLRRSRRPLWPVEAVSGRQEFARAVVSETPALIVGKYHARDWAAYVADVRKLRGHGRVWFVYSHFATPAEGAFIRRGLLGTFDQMGVRLTGIDRTGAHAYLYDLR